ncbi:MAG TPA: NepR family anti-sigma factor [Microvirga sp.]|jgi:RNA polymerase sigma-70 factor (ECF subfamily)|nr:NepR family anti-sigma factor [Microvirga sp.]
MSAGSAVPTDDSQLSSPAANPPKHWRQIQTHLGRHLQTSYADVCAEPLPERLRLLVEQLERALAKGEQVAPWFKEGLLRAMPSLRAFAISLTSNPDRADDLVQETIMRAWDKRDSFQPGTNLNAWLFTILRNAFHSEYRKRSREVEDADDQYATSLRTIPDQMDRLQLQDLREALGQLSPDQREAVLLVGAEGLSYEEAANICGCAVGTIKSRVNRARTRLAELMGYTAGDLTSDNVMQAALSSG